MILFIAIPLTFVVGLLVGRWKQRQSPEPEPEPLWEPRERTSSVKPEGDRIEEVIEVLVPRARVAKVVVAYLGETKRLPVGYMTDIEVLRDGSIVVRAWDDGHNAKEAMLKKAKTAAGTQN